LKPRWRALRKIVHGSEDQPLHASELGHVGNPEHIEVCVLQAAGIRSCQPFGGVEAGVVAF
jgi:hypothetical protein